MQTRSARWLRLLPLAAVWVLFLRALWFDFVNYDDPMFVTGNPLVQRATWGNLWRLVSGPLFGDVQPLSLLTPERAFLVVGDAFAPGWRAEVDGAPVPLLPADGLIRAVELPPGTWRVALRYATPGLGWGLLLSALGVAVWAALAARGA